LTGTTHKFIDTPWVYTHTPTQKADISSVIVSAGKGQQENLDRESEIRTWGGAGNDGGAELLASQAPQEEDVDSPDTEEDEEEPDKVDDDEASATEDEAWEKDNERLFGYDPDREVDAWVEYQAAMQDPEFVY
jgi:hypothetical protein